MTTITSDGALALATAFRDASVEAGNFRFINWGKLDEEGRDKLGLLEISLLNIATDLTTQAVGIIIDESQNSLLQLGAAANRASAALKNINTAKRAITILTSVIGLAAAIPTGDAKSILGAFKNLIKLVGPDGGGEAKGAAARSKMPPVISSKEPFAAMKG